MERSFQWKVDRTKRSQGESKNCTDIHQLAGQLPWLLRPAPAGEAIFPLQRESRNAPTPLVTLSGEKTQVPTDFKCSRTSWQGHQHQGRKPVEAVAAHTPLADFVTQGKSAVLTDTASACTSLLGLQGLQLTLIG